MLLCGPLWVFCGSFVVLCCPMRYLVIPQTKAISVGFRSNLAKISNSNCSIQVGSIKIQTFTVVRNLGLYLDGELSMKHHVAKVAATCHYRLRRHNQIWHHVEKEVTWLLFALVISRLDYCNAALAGLPLETVMPLQQVQLGSSLDLRAEHSWTCYTVSVTVALSFPWNVSNVSVKHYWTNQCRLEEVRPSFNIVNWLHTTMAAQQVQQACILVRRTLHMERCARSACRFRLQKTA